MVEVEGGEEEQVWSEEETAPGFDVLVMWPVLCRRRATGLPLQPRLMAVVRDTDLVQRVDGRAEG